MDLHSRAFLTVGLAIGIVQLYIALSSCWAWVECRRRQTSARSLLQLARATVTRLGAKACLSADEPIPPEVMGLVLRRQVHIAQSFFAVLRACCHPFLAWMLYKVATGSQRWFSPTLDYVFLATYLLATLLKLRPQVLQETTLDLCHSACMISVIIAITQGGTGAADEPRYFTSIVTIMRFTSGLVSVDLRILVFWNAMYLATTLLTQMSQTFGSSVPVLLLIGGETWFTVCLVVGTISVKRLLLAEARLIVESAEVRTECLAVKSLLHAMSDAVLELDKERRIVGAARQLAGMLCFAQRSLDGMCFDRFLSSREERHHLIEQLATQSTASVSATGHVFHLRLRDCLCNVIPVEVFHVCLNGGARSGLIERHLIGVREYADGEGQRRRSAEPVYTADLPVTASPPDVMVAGKTQNCAAGAQSDSDAEDADERNNETGISGSNMSGDMGGQDCTMVVDNTPCEDVATECRHAALIEAIDMSVGDELSVTFELTSLNILQIILVTRLRTRQLFVPTDLNWQDIVKGSKASEVFSKLTTSFQQHEQLTVLAFELGEVSLVLPGTDNKQQRTLTCEVSLTRPKPGILNSPILKSSGSTLFGKAKLMPMGTGQPDSCQYSLTTSCRSPSKIDHSRGGDVGTTSRTSL